jgi:hypothetical protein
MMEAEKFADRLRREAGDDAAAQVDRAFEIALSRKPTPKERADSIEFLRAGELTRFAQVIFSLNEFAFLQ